MVAAKHRWNCHGIYFGSADLPDGCLYYNRHGLASPREIQHLLPGETVSAYRLPALGIAEYFPVNVYQFGRPVANVEHGFSAHSGVVTESLSSSRVVEKR